jgi:D-glycero-D-manno-heptose 1,7-bisphosphate phosphatase
MLIILDRDGVINEESHDYIKSPQEWIPIPGSLKAIAELKKAGHLVVVATNQSGIARGLFDSHMLTKIHEKMQDELTKLGTCLDGIYYCPHQPDDNCHCRKPNTGLFFDIQKAFHCDLHNAVCIGDSLRDIQAAISVGATPILVLTGNGKTTVGQLTYPVITCQDLAQAATFILTISA